MPTIDATSNNDPDPARQSNDGLGQPNPSPTDEIVRRGQEALQRLRRSFGDWLAIAEALQVGRAEIMSAVHTNQPTGKRYETAMAQWLFARGFHLIDKCTRNHLFECHKHRVDIAKWLATMPEGERFKLNHPTTVLRRWKAATVVPVITKPKTLSPMPKLKEINVELQEKLHRAEREIERGGGDLWSSNDAPGDIAAVMINKLSTGKAEKVARATLAAVKVKKAAQAAVTPAPMRRETAACA